MGILFKETPALRQLKQSMPGSSGLPLIGHGLDFITDPVKMGLNMAAELGPVFWSDSLGITMVSMAGPDANQFVLRNKGDLFSNNQGWDYFIGKFFKRGIMLLDFEEHRHHRGIMQAAFKRPVMERHLALMNPAIERGIAKWRPSERFEVLTAIKQLTLDIATEIFMGEALGPEADRVNKAFVDCVRAGTAIVRFPVPGGRWKKGLDGRKLLEQFFASRVAKKRAKPSDDLFSILCQAEDEHGRRFSDEDIVNHMIFLMMAAHDTSTITLSAICYYLGKHPEWQERLRREALALGKRDLVLEDLDKLPDAGLVMKEALRLFSPVHVIPRKTVKDVEFRGYRIPKGTFVMISPIVTHHMPQWWSDPERFDPERFAEGRAEHKRHPYQYVPFGGGAHMCIGLHFAEMQVKTILHHVLQRYAWSVPAGYEMPADFTTLPVPADKLPVRLRQV
ncbi:MAG: cytochrome [Moraxellaceae bacterium]|jgi:cytochrome P450|nr:cytochrome [Moraxellaceae bacterium]